MEYLQVRYWVFKQIVLSYMNFLYEYLDPLHPFDHHC